MIAKQGYSHGKRLVQIQVADITSTYCWICKSDLSVEIGTWVDVNAGQDVKSEVEAYRLNTLVHHCHE